jgi:hypothetical protein
MRSWHRHAHLCADFPAMRIYSQARRHKIQIQPYADRARCRQPGHRLTLEASWPALPRGDVKCKEKN